MENEKCKNDEGFTKSIQSVPNVETESVKEKRPVKLTTKALKDKIDTLQKLRKVKLNKAQKLTETGNRMW